MLKHIPFKECESNRSYIYRTLKQSIVEFYFTPGDKLSEPEIAEELHVSRTPVREALILLESEKLIYILPKKGTFISKINPSEVENFVFIRKSVEEQVLRLACEKITPEDIQVLEEQLQAQKVFFGMQDGRISMYLLDNAFHKIIYQIAGQEASWKWLQKIGGAFNRLRTLDALDGIYSKRRYGEHIELLEILSKGKTNQIQPFLDLHLDASKVTLPLMIEKYPSYFQ